jgi:DNA polymerase elongation subunit (family B)
MKSFYTNISVRGSKILYRGVSDGKRVSHKIDYNPTLFLSSKNPTEYTTIHGEYLAPIKPGSIRDCRDFIEKYKDVDGFKIYGNQRYEYSFIAEEFPDEIEWKLEHINVANIDLEVGSENGFPDPEEASEPITAITVKTNNRFVVFGCGNYNNSRDDVRYVKCDDEIDLVRKFLVEWSREYPDIVTGWNIKFFDIPYLINRITKLLGEQYAKRISPWNEFYKRSTNKGMGQTGETYSIIGISQLDYIELYKKFSPSGNSQESYRLDHIANVEIGEKKLSYEEYGNLHSLYRLNYQKFIDYNIRDTELVGKIDDKLKLIELTLTLAYKSRTNYDDVFSQVRMWDSIIYNHLIKKNIVVPPNTKSTKDAAYIGAYVKDPLLGMHKWVASFDLTSLYPSLIMQYNIGPDTILESADYSKELRQFISTNKIDLDNLLHKTIDTNILTSENVCLTPNGHFYRRDRSGFMHDITSKMFDERQVYKKKMLQAEQEYEKENDPEKKIVLSNEISKYKNLQLAVKVSLNSLYGAAGSEHFRFFDIRQATAITTSGQLTIRWIEKKLNEYMNRLLKTENEDYVIASDTDSVVGETIIVIDGEKTRIDDYFESKNNDFIKNDIFNNNYVKKVHGGVTPSINRKTGEVEYKNVKYVMKHLVRKKMYRITAHNGKKVIVTEDHSLIVRSRESGKIYEVKPAQLSAEKHEIINIIATDTD